MFDHFTNDIFDRQTDLYVVCFVTKRRFSGLKNGQTKHVRRFIKTRRKKEWKLMGGNEIMIEYVHDTYFRRHYTVTSTWFMFNAINCR